MTKSRGFTLIELIVAILVANALLGYFQEARAHHLHFALDSFTTLAVSRKLFFLVGAFARAAVEEGEGGWKVATGDSVTLTSRETMIAKAMVRPNG